jgi:hypothetical protein
MSYRYQLTPLSRRRLKIEYLTPFLKDKSHYLVKMEMILQKDY